MIQSVDRAIRILTALQGARRMTLSELAGRLELPPSTVHGIVRTLVGHGMVVQEHGSGRYQLGPAVLRLGNVYLDTLELRSKAIPWAEDLARRTGCSVRTGVLLLDDVSPPRSISNSNWPTSAPPVSPPSETKPSSANARSPVPSSTPPARP